MRIIVFFRRLEITFSDHFATLEDRDNNVDEHFAWMNELVNDRLSSSSELFRHQAESKEPFKHVNARSTNLKAAREYK